MQNSYAIKVSNEEDRILRLVGSEAKKLGYPAFVVGGYVRDRLLGRDSKDIDFVCEGSGIELATGVSKALGEDAKLSVFKNFGTAHIRHEQWDLEFVGARKESYDRNSRKPAVEDGTIEEDQLRRDFTINAMAVSLNSTNFGELIDPFEGQTDLSKGIIRTPLAPEQTYSDDPLRMMRAIRFASQLGFELEKRSFEAISSQRERIRIISQERITDELNKIVLSNPPSRGFKMLFDTGLLKLIFPEMAKLQGVDVIDGKAHKDNFYHTLQVLDNLSRGSGDLYMRWAAILHDIAKPKTKRFSPEHGWTFHGHEAVGAHMVKSIFKRMKLPLDDRMRFVQKLVQLHLRPISLTKENVTDSAIRRLLFEAGDDIDHLMQLCEADITSKNKRRVQRYLENFEMVRAKLKEVEEKDQLRNWQPPISGELIMKTFDLQPSREVGIIKNAIREAILDGDIHNEYEEAFEFMLKAGKDLGLERK